MTYWISIASASAFINGASDEPLPEEIRQSTVALSDLNGNYCSGIVTDKNSILGAKHCCDTWGESLVAVRFVKNSDGKYGKGDPGFYSLQAGIAVKDHDLCKVKIGDLPQGFRPATLLPSNVPIAVGANVTVAGFGKKDESDVITHKNLRLRFGEMPLLEQSVTEQLLKENANRTETKAGGYSNLVGLGHRSWRMFRSASASTCNADSGGPVFYRYKGKLMLFGIIHGGSEPCDSWYEGISIVTDLRKLPRSEYVQ